MIGRDMGEEKEWEKMQGKKGERGRRMGGRSEVYKWVKGEIDREREKGTSVLSVPLRERQKE